MAGGQNGSVVQQSCVYFGWGFCSKTLYGAVDDTLDFSPAIEWFIGAGSLNVSHM